MRDDDVDESMELPKRLTDAASTGPALVLSGGGALGALQAGFLRALFRTNFKPAVIIGTSAGALNGAFLAFYPDEEGTEKLVDIWRSLRDQSLFLFNPLRIAYQLALRQIARGAHDDDGGGLFGHHSALPGASLRGCPELRPKVASRDRVGPVEGTALTAGPRTDRAGPSEAWLP